MLLPAPQPRLAAWGPSCSFARHPMVAVCLASSEPADLAVTLRPSRTNGHHAEPASPGCLARVAFPRAVNAASVWTRRTSRRRRRRRCWTATRGCTSCSATSTAVRTPSLHPAVSTRMRKPWGARVLVAPAAVFAHDVGRELIAASPSKAPAAIRESSCWSVHAHNATAPYPLWASCQWSKAVIVSRAGEAVVRGLCKSSSLRPAGGVQRKWRGVQVPTRTRGAR